MFKRFVTVCLVALVSFFSSMAANITHAGARQSDYGARPFPTDTEWGYITKNMASYFGDSVKPSAVWIIGTIQNGGTCFLEFPQKDSGTKKNITFTTKDYHEETLAYFDKIGVEVFLQVESGIADIDTLIDLVLSQYSSHKSVIGFGVDAEWYQVTGGGEPNSTLQITDAEASRWEKHVKSYNSDYRLFIKHWDTDIMPPKYRGNIVFIDDSQGLGNGDALASEFADWADAFYPNPVGFQYGYGEDRSWWSTYENPPQIIGQVINDYIPASDQELLLYWVDFTLRDSIIEPLLFKPITPIVTKDIKNRVNDVKITIGKGAVSLRFPYKLSSGSVELLSLSGKKIFTKNFHGRGEFLLNSVKNGVYFLRFKSKEINFTEKITLLR